VIQSTDDSSIKASPSTLQPEKNRESVEQSSSDTNDEYGLGFEGHVTAGFSTPPCPRDCDSNSTTGCCIEGRFNVGVHNPPTEHSCGFFPNQIITPVLVMFRSFHPS